MVSTWLGQVEEGMLFQLCLSCYLEMKVMAGNMATLLGQVDKDYIWGFGGTISRKKLHSIPTTLELWYES